MFRVNLAEAIGREPLTHAKLELVRPAICDGSLMPHEWLLSDTGAVLKTDAIDHGDDHLFPGPCDIAWDLAGAVIEWNLARGERDYLLAAYRRSSGDDARSRVAPYELAYCAFRIGCMRMARLSADARDLLELELLERRYQRELRKRLPSIANDLGRERTSQHD